MVIRGKTRGNPSQLSHYLLRMKDNEAIRLFEVDSKIDPEPLALHRAVFAMAVSAEMSKSNQGLYHTQINPAPGEDKQMTDERWLEAADILGKHLGFENQRRAIVLHTKKGRIHAHVVWERYDHEKGKIISDSFSRLAQDRARKEMELTFQQAKTPHRNTHRPELKVHLTELWESTDNGKDFIKALQKAGYYLGQGVGRTPFMVIDENARSHNLVRQLKGVRLKDVRDRLRKEKLMSEKEAIAKSRAAMEDKTDGGGEGKQSGKGISEISKLLVTEFATSKTDIQSIKTKEQKKLDNGNDEHERMQRYKRQLEQMELKQKQKNKDRGFEID
jgi:hypothetical protein